MPLPAMLLRRWTRMPVTKGPLIAVVLAAYLNHNHLPSYAMHRMLLAYVAVDGERPPWTGLGDERRISVESCAASWQVARFRNQPCCEDGVIGHGALNKPMHEVKYGDKLTACWHRDKYEAWRLCAVPTTDHPSVATVVTHQASACGHELRVAARPRELSKHTSFA